MRVLSLTLLFLSTSTFAAYDPAQTSSELASLNFKCNSNNTSAFGMVCVGKIEEYPKPIAIIIPPGFVSGDKTEIILNLHGDNVNNRKIDWYLENMHFDRLLASTGRNALMLVPLSYAAKESKTIDFLYYLAPRKKFETFMKVMMAVIKTSGLSTSTEISSLILTSHSGGFRTVSSIIERSQPTDNLNEIYLFDSAYGGFGSFVKFAKDPAHRLWSAFSTQGRLPINNSCVMEKMEKEHISFFGCKSVPDNPCGKVAARLARKLASAKCPARTRVMDSEFAENRVGFVQGDEEHYEVYRAYFKDFVTPRRR